MLLLPGAAHSRDMPEGTGVGVYQRLVQGSRKQHYQGIPLWAGHTAAGANHKQGWS